MTHESSFTPEPLAWPTTESEWEDEAGRSGADYVRWLQSSLNQVLGLRLAVDGVVGPATSSAVRSFQQRKGLAVDGIAGPITEAAFVAAGVRRPPVSISAAATGGGLPSIVPAQCSGSGGPGCVVLEKFAQGDEAPGHYVYLLGWWLDDNFRTGSRRSELENPQSVQQRKSKCPWPVLAGQSEGRRSLGRTPRMSISTLGNAVASAKHWFAVRPGVAGGGGICVYQENLNGTRAASVQEQRAWDFAWIRTADPDGS